MKNDIIVKLDQKINEYLANSDGELNVVPVDINDLSTFLSIWG